MAGAARCVSLAAFSLEGAGPRPPPPRRHRPAEPVPGARSSTTRRQLRGAQEGEFDPRSTRRRAAPVGPVVVAVIDRLRIIQKLLAPKVGHISRRHPSLDNADVREVPRGASWAFVLELKSLNFRSSTVSDVFEMWMNDSNLPKDTPEDTKVHVERYGTTK